MKKYLLFILCFISFIDISAQNYSELDLIGKWESYESSGFGNYKFINTLEINNELCINGNSGEWGQIYLDAAAFTKTKHRVLDIFVSSGNILHIYFESEEANRGATIRLRFVINTLSSNELKLSTIDGSRTIFLKKIKESNISTQYSRANESNYYNLQGNKLIRPSDKEVYIHNGKKYVNNDGSPHLNK